MSGHVVVTIARQHGSGGRAVGKLLAQRMGVEYYDRKLLQLAADSTGVAETLFDRQDEVKHHTLLSRITSKVYSGEAVGPNHPEYLTEDNLFNLQAKVITELAEQESCVIIGRCADHILRNDFNVVRVFIYAPRSYLIHSVVRRDHLEPKEAEKSVLKIDAQRGEYYRFHTGKDWADAHNFDLCLDSSRMTQEQLVDVILSYIKIKGFEKE